MTKFSLLCVICLLAASSAFATSTTCQNTTYDQYVAGNAGGVGVATCLSNALTFSNFRYTATAGGAASIVQSSSVDVTPIQTLGFEGFTFGANWTATAGSSQDSTIYFTISGPALTDLHLNFNGSAAGQGSSATVTEQFCLGGGDVTNCPSPLITNNIVVTNIVNLSGPNTTVFDANTFFSPVTIIGVSKDIGVNAGTANGSSAHISTVTNNFSSAVPEPLSQVLLGSGLLGLGLLRKRLH